MKTLTLSTLMCLFCMGVQAQSKSTTNCELPTASVTSSVTDYAMKKYHLAPGTEVKLVESAKANDDCYWKYHFQSGSPQKDIILYLAPDHRYLTSALYDRLSDPLAEEKLQREQLVKLLVGANSPRWGKEDAKVTIVEFADFQCPYCQKLANILEKDVLPSEPDVRVFFRNYPLPMHPFARRAAEAAACAEMQSNDAFWSLHDYLFGHQGELTPDDIDTKLAEEVQHQSKINQKLFQNCLDSGFGVGPVMKDEEVGRKVGVRATPTLFINGSRVTGVSNAAELKRLIAAAKEGRLPPATIDSGQAGGTTWPIAGGNSCVVPPTRGN